MRIKIFQKAIDKLRRKRKLPQALDIIQKFEEFKLYKGVNTLILGHSHLEVGYIATEGEFNLSTSAQDLYYTYHLYKYVNSANIKKIVIPISYFFAWSTLLLSHDLSKSVLTFKKLFNINYQNQDIAKQNGFLKLEKIYFPYIDKIHKKYSLKTHTLGNSAYLRAYPGNFSNIDVEEKGNKIIHALNTHPHIQLEYLQKIIDLALLNNQKIYFVITPIECALRKIIPDKNEIFKEFYNILKKYESPLIKVIDLYDSKYFTRTDFYDYEHVNISGAFKLTKLIKEELERI